MSNEEPYALLMSQHGAGNIEWWDNVIKALDMEGNPTTHPVVYAALGSHANYSRPEVIRSPSMYKICTSATYRTEVTLLVGYFSLIIFYPGGLLLFYKKHRLLRR